MTQDSDRPSPDALIEAARREERGRLKIFLGAAPGVGKTYAMLQEAAVRSRQGVDVVLGLVETHGRLETEALVAGLESLPKKTVAYRGQSLAELDLDGVLARHPSLVIVDELAHSNAPGLRHPKRWQDVMEILDAGIDVTTALNVQHIESLNDSVARITGVRVTETVPDDVVARADEIELIDLPPEELIQRLRDGKVYRGGNIGRALDNFFRKPGLTALRELALRTAAGQVDDQMRLLMRQSGVRGPWPAQERLLVCINESPLAASLVRAGKRMADRAGLNWIVATATTSAHEGLGAVHRQRTADALQLAEGLGADIVTLRPERGIAAALIDLARARNVTRIVIGRPRPRHFWSRREQVASKLLDAAHDFEVTVIAGEPSPSTQSIRLPPFPGGVNWTTALSALAATVLATLVAWPIDHFDLVSPNSLVVIYMIAVLAVGARFGLGTALATAVLCFLSQNWFFTAPRYSLTIQSIEDLAGVLLFLVGAVITGGMAGRLQAQVAGLRVSQRRTEMLLEFSKRIASKTDLDDVLYAAAFHIASILGCQSLLLMPDGSGRLQQVQGYPAIEEVLDPSVAAAADWAFAREEPAGAGTGTLPTVPWLFVPLRASTVLGVVGVSFASATRFRDPETKRLLRSVSDQAAVAVERSQLAAEKKTAQSE